MTLAACPYCLQNLGLPETSTDGELITCNSCEKQVKINGENYRFVSKVDE